MLRIAVFDLDGTLVDSAPDIHAALNRMLAGQGHPPYTLAAVTAMIGDGARVLVERALAGRGRAFDAACLDAFVADEDISRARLTQLFPGILPALAALEAAGIGLAVCTNKPSGPARDLLASLGLGGRFGALGGGDSFPVRKPDPRHLLGTIAAAGADPARAVMIGDHRNDVLAAEGAGIPCVFAGWGYGAPGMEAGARAVAAGPAALPALLGDLLG
jgi:phosphoglycolate phosphatase